MSKKRSNKISTVGSHISTVISMALVLLIVGLLLVISALTSDASDALRSRVAMVINLAPDAPAEEINALAQRLHAEPYAASVAYSSADDVLKQEMQYNGALLEALGENPYTAEFEVFLKPAYVNPDSVMQITQSLEYLDTVTEVYSQSEVIESVNTMLKEGTLALSIIGAVILVVAVVLLFNTIHLVIYSRRFLIRTMQLVGATSSFIRRPFVMSGVWMGLIAAILASLMLCGLHLYAMSEDVDSLFFVSWLQTAGVCGILLVTGILFCGIASAMATNRYLRASYDNLYRK